MEIVCDCRIHAGFPEEPVAMEQEEDGVWLCRECGQILFPEEVERYQRDLEVKPERMLRER